MDAATLTWTRRIAAVACSLLSIGILRAHPPVQAAASPVIRGGDAEQQRSVTWALRRFEVAGLRGLPSLDVHLHQDREGCGGKIGFYSDGRIDLCTKDASTPYARKFALHELAHAWTDANVIAAVRERFMRLRGIDGWNDPDRQWKERGFEQSAEIIAWGLGDGTIWPMLPERADTRELIEAFVLLTDHRPLDPAIL